MFAFLYVDNFSFLLRDLSFTTKLIRSSSRASRSLWGHGSGSGLVESCELTLERRVLFD